MPKKPNKPKRGRPVTTGTTPKWQFRCPPSIKAEVEAAAKGVGETATQFLLTSALERIKRLTRAGKVA